MIPPGSRGVEQLTPPAQAALFLAISCSAPCCQVPPSTFDRTRTWPLRRSTSGSAASAATARPRYSGDSLPSSPGSCCQCCSSAGCMGVEGRCGEQHGQEAQADDLTGWAWVPKQQAVLLSWEARCWSRLPRGNTPPERKLTCAKVRQDTLGAHVAR